jgi:hypothetical protein
MIRLIAFVVLALGITVSAQAMPVAPVHAPDIITQAAYGCGPGMTRVAGVCVAGPPSAKPAGVFVGQEAFAPRGAITERQNNSGP